MRNWLWNEVFKNQDMFYQPIIIAVTHAITSVLLVYVVCVCVDQLRLYFLERPIFKIYDQYEKMLLRKNKMMKN